MAGDLEPIDPPDIVAAREKMSAIKPTSMIRTWKRCTLRALIALKLYTSGVGVPNRTKRVDIVIGLPGAGKTSAIVKKLQKAYGPLLVIDPDMAKEMLPEYEGYGGVAAGPLHVESAAITEEMLIALAAYNGDSFIWAKVGKNAKELSKRIKQLKTLGYEVHLHHVDLPKKKAIERVISRFRETKRFVDPNYIRRIKDGRVKDVFDKILAEGDIDGYSEWSSDIPKGEEPKLIRQKGQEAILP
jgi:predicted ABC-type ATPase